MEKLRASCGEALTMIAENITAIKRETRQRLMFLIKMFRLGASFFRREFLYLNVLCSQLTLDFSALFFNYLCRWPDFFGKDVSVSGLHIDG